MLRRSTTFPVDPAHLWRELTDPGALADWFGYEVEWVLEPGAEATFAGDGEPTRRGRVDEVEPGRRLEFSWWPEDDEAAASRVAYELEPEPDGEGTRLVVTETPEPAATADPSLAPVVALDGGRRRRGDVRTGRAQALGRPVRALAA